MSHKNNYHDLTTALAAVYQSAMMVHDIARGQQPDDAGIKNLLESVVNTSPASINDLYPDHAQFINGQTALMMHMDPKQSFQAPQILRYVFDLMYLAKKLKKSKRVSRLLLSQIEKSKRKLSHYSITDRNMIESLGDIYLDTVSTLPYRIHVMGKPNVVQAPFNAKKIRAILLGGIRAAHLWYQLGGSRLHYYTKKNRYYEELKNALQIDKAYS